MKYIKDQKNLNGMRVLLRLDLNVPLSNGIITDQTRIDKIIPIIELRRYPSRQFGMITKTAPLSTFNHGKAYAADPNPKEPLSITDGHEAIEQAR